MKIRGSIITLVLMCIAAPDKRLSPPAFAADLRPLAQLPYTPSLDTSAMDPSIDPCVDFFEYSCGSWPKSHPIPGDQPRWEVYDKVEDDNLQYLWGILTEAAKPEPARSSAQQKIGDFFDSCMDESKIDALGAKPLAPELAAIAALASPSEIAGYLGHIHQTVQSGGFLFDFGADQDLENSEQVIPFASAGGLGLPDRDYYLKNDANSVELRRKYADHIVTLLTLAGGTKEAAAQGAKDIVRIETALAKASLSEVEQRDPYNLSHKMPVDGFQKLTPGFAWSDYFKASNLSYAGDLNVTEPKFFKAAAKILKREKMPAWRSYLRFHLVNDRSPFLSAPFVQAGFDFYGKTLRGIKELSPRWKRCVGYADDDLGEALGQVFVEKTFSPAVKAETVEMVRRIEAVMADRIQKLDWMSEPTKKQALVKLRAMDNKVGYPDRWRDYSALSIVRGDFLGNEIRATAFESKRQLAKIGKPVDRTEWGMTPPTVNAGYSPQLNDMNFPAGVLQPPLFDPKMDAAPNYGNTGSTIGHELTHGFDDEGRQFDATGNLRDWWTEADAKEFEKRAQCIVDQYARYTVVDDIRINSRLTEGEDVADLGGTVLAYIAWKEATKGLDLKPSEGLTPDQRFFVGLAQWACGTDRPENLRLNAATDPHSPARYRINGVVVNMPEFAEAFSCKAGQPMVKEKGEICRIW